MPLLTAEQLLTRDELVKEKVVLGTTILEPAVFEGEELLKEAVVEEDYVYVRQMTAHEKNVWEMSQLQKTGEGKKASYDVVLDDYRAKLAVVCVCDESGNLLFKPNQYALLSKNIGAAKLEKIVDVAQRLNAVTEEDRELMVKNS